MTILEVYKKRVSRISSAMKTHNIEPDIITIRCLFNACSFLSRIMNIATLEELHKILDEEYGLINSDSRSTGSVS